MVTEDLANVCEHVRDNRRYGGAGIAGNIARGRADIIFDGDEPKNEIPEFRKT